VGNLETVVSWVHGVDRITTDMKTGRVLVDLTHAHDTTNDLLSRAVMESGFTLERIDEQ